MSVNTMSIEDAYTLMASLHQQATGATAVTPTDLSSFISVAQATAVNGWGPVVNGISQIVGKTIVAVRNYNRKFGGLEWTADKWAAVVRKLSFIDTDPISSPVFQLVDGSSPDMFSLESHDTATKTIIKSAKNKHKSLFITISLYYHSKSTRTGTWSEYT